MSDAQRYDPGLMADHVNGQMSQVNRLNDLHNEAQNAIESIRAEWTGSGFNGCDEAHRQVALAFQKVFNTIGHHGKAIGTSCDNSMVCDSGVQAGFTSI